jgi:hypothetical protein
VNQFKNNSQIVNIIHEKIKRANNLSTDQELAEYLSVKPNTLSMQRKRGMIDFTSIIERCNELDFNWLFKDHDNIDFATDAVVDYKFQLSDLEKSLSNERKLVDKLKKELEKANHQISVLKEIIDSRK